LLSDESHTLVEAWRLVEKACMGKNTWERNVRRRDNSRDGNPQIKSIFRKVKPEEHTEKVLDVHILNRDSLLTVYNRLTGLVEKLPGGLRKPILRELTQSTFLEQRPARLLLVGNEALTPQQVLSTLGAEGGLRAVAVTTDGVPISRPDGVGSRSWTRDRVSRRNSSPPDSPAAARTLLRLLRARRGIELKRIGKNVS